MQIITLIRDRLVSLFRLLFTSAPSCGCIFHGSVPCCYLWPFLVIFLPPLQFSIFLLTIFSDFFSLFLHPPHRSHCVVSAKLNEFCGIKQNWKKEEVRGVTFIKIQYISLSVSLSLQLFLSYPSNQIEKTERIFLLFTALQIILKHHTDNFQQLAYSYRKKQYLALSHFGYHLRLLSSRCYELKLFVKNVE